MHFIVNTEPMDVYAQMAFDEKAALSSEGKTIYLRFYNWTEGSAVTFGYAQSHFAVEREMAESSFSAPAVRRPTGGGVVYHKDDLTFSIIFPVGNLKLKDIYSRLHGVINTHLESELNMYDGTSNYAPQTHGVAGACFKNPVESDLVQSGQKVLGGALRKYEKVYLYQGSFQRARARTDAKLKQQIAAGVAMFFGVQFKEMAPAKVFLESVKKEAVKYKSDEWNRKL